VSDLLQEPTLDAYGLSPNDPARCERWEGWLVWSPIARVAIAGGGGFLLVGFISGSPGVAGVACIAWLVSVTEIGDRLDESVVAALLPKLPRYREFRVAHGAFEAARKEAEEQELRRRSAFWLTLSGHAFERELATVLERTGYEVTRTPGLGDGGIDLVLRQPGRTIVVQCKQTKQPVGPGAARDLYGALTHCGADLVFLALCHVVW
jgi:Restriction endonuclease